ncbi:MAG: hypothetical protein U0234_33615 [Sandaracinus sp.]
MTASITFVPSALLALAAPLAAQGATFTPLDIPETGYFSPTGVSADGNTVVGMAYVLGLGDKARRWRNGVGFDDPAPSGGPVANWCASVSADGATIAGGTGHAAFGDLEGWMRYGASTGHVGSPPGHDTSDCLAVAADGVVSVGYGGHQSNPNLYEAAKYTEQSGWTNLGFLPGHSNSKALAVNADGSVIVGWSAGGFQSTQGYRWTAASGMQPIPRLAGGTEAYAQGVRGDGAVVVGGDYVVTPTWTSYRTPWRWSATSGTSALLLPAGADEGWALCIGSDGALAGGWSSSAGGWTRACVWDAQGAVYDVLALLEARGLGAQLAGWELTDVTGIAGTGPWYLVGDGSDATGEYGAWLVRLDALPEAEPGAAFCFGDDSGTPCPCANPSAPATGGCMSSLGLGGALRASGVASVGADTLRLVAWDLPNSTTLYFQGSTQENGGAGTLLGDGLLCVGGSLVRLGAKTNAGGGSSYPQAGDAPVSVRGAATAGATLRYQGWYRNAAAWCTSATFNLTNGYEVLWTP